MAKISLQAARQRVETLRKELERHSHNYYVLNAPTISDFEFDLLMQELQGLEKMFPSLASADSPSVKVGSDLTSDFLQVAHKYPMLSLGNTYSIGEMEEFGERISRTVEGCTYSCELKFDGTGISLTYRDGALVHAVTRGDGLKGDDVTRNVVNIPCIPRTLRRAPGGPQIPQEFEIRGEIYMPFADFERLNREKAENGEQPFANPRNAASGSLKLQNPLQMRSRGLDCVLYHMLGDNLPFKTHCEAIEAARSWGLPTSEYARRAESIADAIEYIRQWDTRRKELPFATDGVVIKVNELALQRQLGFTAKSPRWATAYKFKPESALTPLLSIDYQVGRTGAITPVANLEPVPLSGTTIRRASLHNKDQMDLLDIHIGDWVYIEKGGEIIPKITAVEVSKRPAGATRPHFPEVCPLCGTQLVRDDEQARHYCPNTDRCPEQIKGRLIHFISRKAMDILAGEATICQLYDAGLIRTPDDLYSLKEEDLLKLEGWQSKSVENFLQSLEHSKAVPFTRVLGAIGIRHVGETTARMLASHFKSIDSLMAASREELLQIDEVGGIMADSLLSYFADPRHREMIEKLRAIGLQMEIKDEEFNLISNVLEGCTVVISGNYSISREEMKSLVASHGGKVTGSVSGSTTYLLAGEKAGPEKLRKAEKLGIKIISEEEFYNIIK